MLKKTKYDAIVCGAGPAGLSAAIYLARGSLKTLLIEKQYPGGQMANTHLIENYPGVPNANGVELAMAMAEQATELGVEIVYDFIKKIDFKKKEIKTVDNIYTAPSIIIAFGATSRQLGLENEDKLTGKGVGYCAICDGALYRNQPIFVIGGGNTALEDALYLLNFSKDVYLVHRRDEFRATGTIVDKVKKSKVKIIYDSVPEKLLGDDKLSGVVIKNVKTGKTTEYKAGALFVAIGQEPNIELVKDDLKLSKKKYIVVDEKMRTNIGGVYACGDIIDKEIRQIVTACSDGVIAALDIIQKKNKE